MNPDQENGSPETNKLADLKAITEALQGLKFGSVNIIVQDGVIVQIDRTEKRRLRRFNESTDGRVSPRNHSKNS